MGRSIRQLTSATALFLATLTLPCAIMASHPEGERPGRFKHIVIDPGHGGDNLGALSFNGVYEKGIVLAVALALKQHVEANSDIKVTLTRSTDKALTLQQRIEIANAAEADLFLSLHANIAFNHTSKGAEVLVLSQEAMDKEAKRLTWVHVQRQGRLSDVENNDAAAMVKEMMQHGGLVDAKEMGSFVLGRLAKKMKLATRGVKQGAYGVLKGAEMPAMVIEMGFLSNPDEAKNLSNQQYQERLAKALAEAIIEYAKQP